MLAHRLCLAAHGILGVPAGTRTGRYASAGRAFISPTAFEQARGGALGAGGGRVVFEGAASSESATGFASSA